MKQSQVSYESGIPVYDAKQGIQTLPGGFQLVVTSLIAGSIIPAGSALVCNEIARTATLHKTTKLYEDATDATTTIKVVKGSQFTGGEFIGKGTGVKSVAITSIDRTGSQLFDTVVLGAALGYALVAGDSLVQATSANASAVIVKPNGLSYNDVVAEANATTTAVIGAVAYLRRIPAILPETQLLFKSINFTNSK